LFVKGAVNGEVCDFILDTGASKTVFAMNMVGEYLDKKPESKPDIQSTGINAIVMESLQGVIRDFKLGDFLIKEMNVVLIDLSSINELYKTMSAKSIWGLIGGDFFLKYKARIDYGKRMLTIKVN
jgi:hypothetical protein